MDRYERILTLHRLLKSAHYPVPLPRLMDELECSRATLYRDVAFLRDALGAPIESGGGEQASFRYELGEGERFELPGLWLTSDELAALLALNELIGRSGPGVLAGALAPFKARIEGLLSDQGSGKALPIDRIRVIPWGERKLDQQVFRIAAGAVLERKQLRFRYRARTTNADSRRTVSPQRLTHYRDNWYLDVWDHDREALRSFAVDRIVEAARARCGRDRRGRSRPQRPAFLQLRHLRRQAQGLGDHPLLASTPRAGSPTSTGIRSRRANGCRTAATS